MVERGVRFAASICLALSLGASCEKAPPEPLAQALPGLTPVATAEAGALGAAAAAKGPRCVRPTPAAAPPAVPPGPNPACPRDPAGGPPMVSVGHVAFPESSDAPKLEVE